MKKEYSFSMEIDDGEYCGYCNFKKGIRSLQDCDFIANEIGVHEKIDGWIDTLKDEEIEIVDEDFPNVKVFTKEKKIFLEVNDALYLVLEIGIKLDKYSDNLIFNISRASKEECYKEYDGKIKRQEGGKGMDFETLKRVQKLMSECEEIGAETEIYADEGRIKLYIEFNYDKKDKIKDMVHQFWLQDKRHVYDYEEYSNSFLVEENRRAFKIIFY